MATLTVTRNQQFLGILAWLLLFVACSVNGWGGSWFLSILGAPLILIVPGYLSLLVFEVPTRGVYARGALAVGLSIVELYILGLITNTFLPLAGIARPLDTESAVWIFSTLVLSLLVLSWWRMVPTALSLHTVGTYVASRDMLFVLAPLGLVGASIAGAYVQNNGGANTVTLMMLGGVALYVWMLFRRAESLQEHTVLTGLFFTALALLFMTSLRGWFIAGHDIQREFFAFQLTKDSGVWSMAAFRDAYNACLSITILPTMLANMLHVADIYVFKVLFQIIFAVTPIIVYVLARRLLTPSLSVLASVVFMAFPTFFQDMPFLTRQEIAFLMVGLMFLVLFDRTMHARLRTPLVLLFGLGIVLSHYSTTYTILFMLWGTAIATPIVFRLVRYIRRVPFFKDSAVGPEHEHEPLPERTITATTAFVLTIAAFVWTAGITGTDGHTRDVARGVWSAVVTGVGEESRSVDVLALFSFGRVQSGRTIDEYITNVVDQRRSESPDEYYASSTYSTFPIQTIPPTSLAVTSLGAWPTREGFNIHTIFSFLGSSIAKLIQVALVLGFVYVLIRRRWIRAVPTEQYVVTAAALFFVLLCVVLPLLSVEYGLFRAIQQSMVLFAPFLVVGLLVLGTLIAWPYNTVSAHIARGLEKDTNKKLSPQTVAGILGVLFLLYATGSISQIIGGNLPPIHLNNRGDEYNHYVTEPEEVRAIEWLEARLEADIAETGTRPVVQSDRYGEKKLRAFLLERVSGDIFPGSIRKDSYVFIGPAILERNTATVSYEGALIKYYYPLDFLDANKEVLYDNGRVRIYH